LLGLSNHTSDVGLKTRAELMRAVLLRTIALSLLTEVYNGFTKGFGTADLQEAKALLHKLTH
jgi:hypothetical protein